MKTAKTRPIRDIMDKIIGDEPKKDTVTDAEQFELASATTIENPESVSLQKERGESPSEVLPLTETVQEEFITETFEDYMSRFGTFKDVKEFLLRFGTLEGLNTAWKYYDQKGRQENLKAKARTKSAISILALALEFAIQNDAYSNAKDLILDIIPYLDEDTFVDERLEKEIVSVLIDDGMEMLSSVNEVHPSRRKNFARQINIAAG